MYKHILIPTDGSPTAAKAVEAGIDYARETAARVTFFIAVPEYPVPYVSEDAARKPVMSVEEHERRSAEKRAPSSRPRSSGRAPAASNSLRSRAEQQAVRGDRRGGEAARLRRHLHGLAWPQALSRLPHGSQTLNVLTHSDIPTLVLR